MAWNLSVWKHLGAAEKVVMLAIAAAGLVVAILALKDNSRANLIMAPPTRFTLIDAPPSALVQINIRNVGNATAENVVLANSMTLLLPLIGSGREREPDWSNVRLPDRWNPGDVYDKEGHRVNIAQRYNGLPLAPTDQREIQLNTQDADGPVPFDAGDLVRLRTAAVAIAAFARFTYTDHSGKPRITRACRYWDPKLGGVADCPRWNTVE